MAKFLDKANLQYTLGKLKTKLENTYDTKEHVNSINNQIHGIIDIDEDDFDDKLEELFNK